MEEDWIVDLGFAILHFFYKEVYSLLLFDLSCHGNSGGGGRGFSYGIREREDVKAAVNWLKKVKNHKLVVAVGTSVGGAAAILAAAEDKNIDGLVVENPVSRADALMLEHLEKMISLYTPPWFSHYLLKPYYQLVVTIFKFRIGGFFSNPPVTVIDRISPRPILLMHGTNDDVVPCIHSERLFEAAKEPKTLWLASEAWHCALYDKFPDQYKLKFKNFMTHWDTSAKPEDTFMQINKSGATVNFELNAQGGSDAEGTSKESIKEADVNAYNDNQNLSEGDNLNFSEGDLDTVAVVTAVARQLSEIASDIEPPKENK